MQYEVLAFKLFLRNIMAWSSIIIQDLKRVIKIILLSPSPGQRVNIFEPNCVLEQLTRRIEGLANGHSIGYIDSNELYRKKILKRDSALTHIS